MTPFLFRTVAAGEVRIEGVELDWENCSSGDVDRMKGLVGADDADLCRVLRLVCLVTCDY